MVGREARRSRQVKCAPSIWLVLGGIVDNQSKSPCRTEWCWVRYIVMHQIVAFVESAFEMAVVAFA